MADIVNEDKLISFERLKDAIRQDVSPLTRAVLEDEAVRIASQKRSAEYLDIVEKEKNYTPQAMWYFLFFLLGFLTCLSEPAVFYLFWNGLK